MHFLRLRTFLRIYLLIKSSLGFIFVIKVREVFQVIREVYLDNSATTKPYKEVISTMNTLLEKEYGNPSSIHSKGVSAFKAIAESRKIIALSLGVEPNEIYFSSGGTESNNLAILGAVDANSHKGKHIITSVIEHPSVLNTFKYLKQKGYEVEYIGVDNNGFINLEDLKNAIRKDSILVSIMYVNNEIGTIQSIKEISNIIKSRNPDTLLHVDAVQAYGKMDTYPRKIGADLLSVSAHKIHGPKGIGALYKRRNLTIHPIIFGGGQELAIRPGTENVISICGFSKAVEITFQNKQKKWGEICYLRNMLKDIILKEIPIAKVNTPADHLNYHRVAPHILNVSFGNIHASSIVQKLDLARIYASTRSACSCKEKLHSDVLKSIGLNDKLIKSAIRFSLSTSNTKEDIEYTALTLKNIICGNV